MEFLRGEVTRGKSLRHRLWISPFSETDPRVSFNHRLFERFRKRFRQKVGQIDSVRPLLGVTPLLQSPSVEVTQRRGQPPK